MLVVLCTHLGDRQLTIQLAERIRTLGGVKTHECLIVSPFGTPMQGIEDVLRQAFGTVNIFQYRESMGKWPAGANEACQMAIARVPQVSRYHFLMLEPDCVPTTPEWLNRIDMEYRRSGAQVLGVGIATTELSPPHRAVGRHVIGVAVYPNNFGTICPLVRNLTAMTSGHTAQNIMPPPWDVYFGPYTTRMLTETRLIHHLARQMFKVDEKTVRFDCPSLENALEQYRSRNDAVLIHGSKNPKFLQAIANPHITQTYASEKRDGQPESKHLGDAPRPELQESPPTPRKEEGKRDGHSGGVLGQPEAQVVPVVTGPIDKKAAAAQRRADKQRREQIAWAESEGISAKEYPILPGTPQWQRMHFLYFDKKKMPWPKLRSYAVQLGIPIYKVRIGPLVNAIVRKEEEDRKEPWTKDLPQAASDADEAHNLVSSGSTPEPATTPEKPVEAYPQLPPGALPPSANGLQTTVTWGSVDTAGRMIDDRPAEIGPSMQEKMLALQRQRQLAGAV